MEDWSNEIVDNVFLGSVRATQSGPEMDQKGITHILSLGEQKLQSPSNLVDYLFIDIDDHELAEIYPHLPTAIAFIENALASGGKVLVHCMAGSSRSGSCVIAYIMVTQKLPYFDALRQVQAKRSLVRPNLAFGQQLIKFEQDLALQ